ncbi:MAG TPA: hypothetical protein VFK69_11140, partial [Candidatus Eisenbacteria bacterium]|nr:hypothetical protein [Candidatus Eisenbacteria bacterium]
MPDVHRVTPRHGDVLVLAGTTKGLFVLRSNARRQRWEIGGPQFPGAEVYAVAGVRRNGDLTLWAANGNPHFGTFLSRSTDFGTSWVTPEEAPIRFPEDTGAALRRVWQIQPGIEPGVLYAGVEPSALFVSRDDGKSWTLVRGLWDHPHRERWTPGGGGQCLHTIVPHPTDPDRMLVAMSTGGVYRTEDGGRTWHARNAGVRAEFMPDKYPEFGQCVHKVVRHPSRPDRLFLQNHWGLYRSDDGGDSWQDIAHDVPSDFGFAMAMHPHDAETVYVVPIESDRFRCTPEGKLRVYRTRDAGGSWEPLTRGLPQKNALETILRDGMTVDALNPAGVYFGTRSGSVWASANGGASWMEAATGLPPVLSVRAVVVGDPTNVRVPRATAARAANKRTTRRARP